MLMVQEFDNRSSRPLSNNTHKHSIIMIAPRTLTTECLVEVLIKNFPDHYVTRHEDVAFVTEEESEDCRLVLIYRPGPQLIWKMLERLHEHDADHSIGIVVENIDEAEGIFHQMAGTDRVDGVVPLDLRLDVFLAAVRLLAKGGEHFPSALLQRLRRDGGDLPIVRHKSIPSDDEPELDFTSAPTAIALTTREIQILDLLCRGTQNKIIADQLRLSENTVKVHIRNIYKKMRVRNRTEAASRFFRKNFAAPGRAKPKG